MTSCTTRFLKATLSSLARCLEVDRQTRHDLRNLSRRLNDVSDIRLSSSSLRRVMTSRNNRDYAFLMRLCEFVFCSLMPDERGATARFQRVAEDEARISAVFEESLRNFYRLHRPEYRVRSESTEWQVSGATQEDRALLPRMITDITLRNADRTAACLKSVSNSAFNQ